MYVGMGGGLLTEGTEGDRSKEESLQHGAGPPLLYRELTQTPKFVILKEVGEKTKLHS